MEVDQAYQLLTGKLRWLAATIVDRLIFAFGTTPSSNATLRHDSKLVITKRDLIK